MVLIVNSGKKWTDFEPDTDEFERHSLLGVCEKLPLALRNVYKCKDWDISYSSDQNRQIMAQSSAYMPLKNNK